MNREQRRRIGHERWLRNLAVALGNALAQDPPDASEIRLALQQRLAAELPYAFLWNEDNIVVHNRRWSGFAALPNGRLQALSKVRATP